VIWRRGDVLCMRRSILRPVGGCSVEVNLCARGQVLAELKIEFPLRYFGKTSQGSRETCLQTRFLSLSWTSAF
jgi:hypothetical protein